MTLGKIWSDIINRNSFSSENIKGMSAWAMRVYFGPKNADKIWFREGVNEDSVLDEFCLPDSPISPRALVEVWTAMPSLQRALGVLTDNELDTVSEYLQRNATDTGVPKYTQGDCTLKEMASSLGNITGTMVNKIFISGADKVRRLTGGVSPSDMEPEAFDRMMEFINTQQLKAANAFAGSLLEYDGDIAAFLENQVKLLHLTEIERLAVTENEIQGLMVISELPHSEIVDILLTDLEEDTLFLTFQNAASKAIFPRRAGRPKGSFKKVSVPEDYEQDEEVPEAMPEA
jgi:hypothetical protein